MNGTINIDQALTELGISKSKPRRAIYEYLMTHRTHPTVEDVYHGLHHDIPSLSRTTVYNTLRMFSEHGLAQMITIDEHRVCYDGDVTPHVHFFCKHCGRIIDLFEETPPNVGYERNIDGNIVSEAQLYYKGICADCMKDIG